MKAQEHQMGLRAKQSEMGMNLQTKALMNRQALRQKEESHAQNLKLKENEPRVGNVRVRRSAVQTDRKRGDKT